MDIIKNIVAPETQFILIDADRQVHTFMNLAFVPRVGDTISIGKNCFEIKSIVIHCGAYGEELGFQGIEINVQKMKSPRFRYDNLDFIEPSEF
tara:strand:- start:5285 stop:5563 length:279 start_codon:yes stop_codon:yes gene_type:complete